MALMSCPAPPMATKLDFEASGIRSHMYCLLCICSTPFFTVLALLQVCMSAFLLVYVCMYVKCIGILPT